jgi:sulfur-carrier protein
MQKGSKQKWRKAPLLFKLKIMTYESISEDIQVTVKLFAIFQEVLATDEMQITLAPGTSVSQIFDRLVNQHPHLEKWRSLTRYAVNLNFADPQTILKNGDEVALIPPVSGG